MPLHGKIVVIKRSGRDGTELPLTATCLFGRNPECDIRIQLPEVSKEHCRIELNENKEVILTNLSLVNPTRINGKVIQQSKRLNHGDVIMINERSFRFEYPPEPTPKKRGQSTNEKSETLQVLQNQHLKHPAGAQVSGEKEQSCLKDGTNITNLQFSKDQGCENTEKETFSTSLEQANPNEKESLSPFSELYQIIKQNLNTKTPWKPSGVQQKTLTPTCESQTPIQAELKAASNESSLKLENPKSTRRSGKLNAVEILEKTGSFLEDNTSTTPNGKKAENSFQEATTPAVQTSKKGRRSCQTPTWELKTSGIVKDTPMTASERKTPLKFSGELNAVKTLKNIGSSLVMDNTSTTPTEKKVENSFQEATTPAEQTPKKGRRSCQSPTWQLKTPDIVKDTPMTASERKTPLKFSGKLNAVKTLKNIGSSLVMDNTSTTPTEKKAENSFQEATTPAEQTPKKGRRSCQSPTWQLKTPDIVKDTPTTASQRKTPQKFSAEEVVRQITSQDISEVHEMTTEKSVTPNTRRSKGGHSELALSPHTALTQGNQSSSPPAHPFTFHSKHAREKNAESSSEAVPCMSPKTKVPESSQRVSPRSTAGKKLSVSDVLCELESAVPSSGECKGNKSFSCKKRRCSDLESDLPQLKRKRVSFGGQLSPELFDKRLPPNSPLRKGATPGRRSLSVITKQQSLLRRASVIGLIQELPGDQLGSESPECPEKKTSTKNVPSRSRTPSPAKKSPNVKSKTPSPSRKSFPKVKPEDPQKNCEDEQSPKFVSTKSPNSYRSSSKSSASRSRKSPTFGSQMQMENVAAEHQTRNTPYDTKSPCSEQKSSSKTSSPERKSLFLNDSLSGQTPTIRGRFSVSRIETPSPVGDISVDISVNAVSEASAPLTPKIPLRRKSLKSSTKTPKSSQKSALEVIRSRRSGASCANLKVVRSWADIVKFGAAKPQAGVKVKKQIRRKAVKKAITQKPKTPQKIKEHFSTGHAASPATIIVGKAHARTVMPAGCAPKLVRNVALLKKNITINEDFTGVAEMFSTPLNMRKKTNDTGAHRCSKTPQNAPSAEVSVMKTPEETGEMLVSPLSIVANAKQGSYYNDAVLRLLHDDQEFSFTCEDSLRGNSETLTNTDVQALEANPLAHRQQDVVIGRKIETPKQKPKAVTPLTGVKRIMKTPKQKVHQMEDLRGIKTLLKTPKNPKVVEEVNLLGVKKLLKTPKVKGQPVENMVGVQRLMKTPKIKARPLVCTTGVKRLMHTPKSKRKPIEDFVGMKRLMRTPRQKKNEPVEDMVGVKRLMRTPRQKKNEPVEDMVGVKRLMRTPKQKNEPVEDMVGVKRLMRTPRQKNEPVEDMVGVKRLMRTPKEKGKPVESNFGIAKLMKSPRRKAATPVEDYTGLQELMQEPVKYSSPFESNRQSRASKADIAVENPSSLKYGHVLTSTDTEITSEEPVKLLKEVLNDCKEMALRPLKKSDVSDDDFKSADYNVGVSKDSVLPDVRPKRRTKVCRAETPILKEEINKAKVASPAKLTRGRKAKLVEPVKDQQDRNLDQKVTNEVSKQWSEGEKNTQVLSPNPTTPIQTSVKGRRARTSADITENPPVSSTARKVGRRRGTKQTDEEKIDVETTVKMNSIEAPPQTLAEIIEDQRLRNMSPMTKRKRGRQNKLDVKDGICSGKSLDTRKEGNSDAVGTEIEPAAPVKPRCEKISIIVKQVEQPLVEPPSKRTRRGAADLTVPPAVPCLPSSRPVRRKNVGNNLDDVQGETCVQPKASIECKTKSVKKTRECRKAGQILNAQTVSLSVSTPSKEVETVLSSVEPLVSTDLAVEIPKKGNKNRKAASQNKTNKADKNSSVEKAVYSNSSLGAGVSKRLVTSSPDLSDNTKVKTLRVSKRSGKENVETGEVLVVEMQQTAETPVKPRRGRMAKNNPQVMELPVPKTQDTVLFEVMAQPLRKRGVGSSKCDKSESAVDVLVAKRSTSRKLASKKTAKELPLHAESSVESSKTALNSKQTRKKAADVEVKTEASTEKTSSSARKAGKGLEDVQAAGSPQPVRRGRKRAAQNVQLEPEPEAHQEKKVNKKELGMARSAANASNPGTTTRGRGNSKTKPDGLNVTEARPVRCTRRR